MATIPSFLCGPHQIRGQLQLFLEANKDPNQLRSTGA